MRQIFWMLLSFTSGFRYP